MKKSFLSIVIVLLLAFAFLPASGVLAQTPTPPPEGTTYTSDQIVVANTYRLASGDTLAGNLLVIGGTATVEQGAVVNGDIIIVGGTISIAGTTQSDLIAIGGAVNVEDYAVINGDMVMIGASLKKSPLAKINGDITQQTPKIFDFNFADGKFNLPVTPIQDPLTRMLNAAFQALAMGALAVIIGLLLPRQLKRVTETIVKEPLITGGIGLLTVVVAPIVLVLMTITILLIPVTLLSIIILMLALLFGFVAVGLEVGDRLASLFKTNWNPPISAGIGTLLLSLVTGFASLIPCIGWLIGLIVSIIGLGAVIISRFGSSRYAEKLANAVLPSRNLVPQVGGPEHPDQGETLQ